MAAFMLSADEDADEDVDDEVDEEFMQLVPPKLVLLLLLLM